MNSSTANSKLWAFLAYFVPFLGSGAILLTNMKDDAALRAHAVQGLALSATVMVLSLLLSATGIGGCLGLVAWVPGLYYGIQAYQSKDFALPLLTDFCKKQGWM